MKARESGMPDEQMWEGFFDTDAILDGLGICDLSGNIVDLGCAMGHSPFRQPEKIRE